ncbi:MAG: hypothetical protein KC505_07460 [Myxococcales bacterium]|nr:hypothetical protein [Myxococcales bacterium]USN51596.1 MAG: hypothetical protein H6731_04075 [Myxococcales bacterium]
MENKKVILFQLLFFVCSCGQDFSPKNIVKTNETIQISEKEKEKNYFAQLFPKTLLPDISAVFQKNEISNSSKDLRQIFEQKREIGGGKSGAKILLLETKGDVHYSLILKTLHPIKNDKDLWSNIAFREIYFSKMLSQLRSKKFLPADMSAADFFPDFFGFGTTDSLDPFSPGSKSTDKKIPFYLMEKLEGMTLYDFAINAKEAKEKFGYNLKEMEVKKIFSIILQMAVALQNAYKETGFIHLDAHPGNIFLTTKKMDGIIFSGFGREISLVGPKVKIIDFDQSETLNKATPRPQYKLRPILGRGKKLYEAEGGSSLKFSLINLKAIATSENTDVRMLNVLFHTFDDRFKNASGKINIDYFASTISEFIEFLFKIAPEVGFKNMSLS